VREKRAGVNPLWGQGGLEPPYPHGLHGSPPPQAPLQILCIGEEEEEEKEEEEEGIGKEEKAEEEIEPPPQELGPGSATRRG
jgi:hypothetical protein